MQSPERKANVQAVNAVYKLKEISREIAERGNKYGIEKLTIQDVIDMKNEGRKY